MHLLLCPIFQTLSEVLSDSERRVDVSFCNEVTRCTTPRLFQTSVGRVVHLEDATWQYPGKPPVLRDEACAPKLKDHLCRAALKRFREAEAKSLQQRGSVAKAISRCLMLRLKSPLQLWDRSLGKVLAVPSTGEQEAFVGLLMQSSVNPTETDVSYDVLRPSSVEPRHAQGAWNRALGEESEVLTF